MSRGFDDIRDLLSKSLKSMNLEHKTKEHTALIVWSQVVGARIAKATSAERIRDGILFVGCSSATWANELTFLKGDIITKLNKKLGGKYVKDIRFAAKSSRNGPVEAPAEEAKEIPEKEFEAIRLSEEDEKKIEAAALEAGDQELAARMRRALTSSRKLDEWKKAHGWKTCSSCGLLYEDGNKTCPECRK